MAVHGVPAADQLDDDTFLGMVNSLYASYAEVDRSTGARRDYMKRWLEVEAAEDVPEETPKQQQPVQTLAVGELEDEPPVTSPAYFEPGRYEGISNDAYHSANGVSITQVKDARISLMYFHGRHVNHTEHHLDMAYPDGWIKCNERMPKKCVEVLIRISCNERFNIENGKYKGDGTWIGAWRDTYGRKVSAYQVAHWMPLPAAPKPEM